MTLRHGLSKRAFTLIELLVVIAIIAILASIIVPNLSNARESSKIVYCAANLKSMGVALTLYADDHKFYLPPVSTEASGGVIWDQQLQPYLTDDDKIFVCPSDTMIDRTATQTRRTYACNGGFAQVSGRADDLPFGSYGSNTAHRLDLLKSRSGRIVLIGERPGTAVDDRGYVGGFSYSGMDQAPATIHRRGRGGNYLMADMAVTYMDAPFVVITDSNDLWYVEQ